MAPKRPLDASAEQSGRNKKRQKINHARQIQTGPSVASAAPPGSRFASASQLILTVCHPVLKQLPLALDVAKFTEVITVFGISTRDSCCPQARAFEINAMQKTMQSVK